MGSRPRSRRLMSAIISYYGYWLWCLLGDGSNDLKCTTALAGSGVMVEYPLPAVWFLELLYTLGAVPLIIQ